jgi:DNA-binding transcriptional regulator YiaG
MRLFSRLADVRQRLLETHAFAAGIRALIQLSQATNAALSQELGVSVKTVAKWRKRKTVEYRYRG